MGSPAWEIINEIFVALERQQYLKPVMDVYDAAMALEQEQAKHGTDAFSQERFDQLATALIHACRRAKEGR